MSTNVDAKKRWYDCTSSACRSGELPGWCATSWCQSPPYETKRDVSPYASTPIRLVPHMNPAAATSFHSCSCFPASSGVLALCLLALSAGVVTLEHDAPLTTVVSLRCSSAMRAT